MPRISDAGEGTLIKRAFNGGELAPWVEGRTDLPTYRASSRRIENMIPTPQGGLVRRPGTRYVSTLANEARMIPFSVSRGDSYILLLGNYEMRFVRDGGILNYSNVTAHARNVNIVADQLEIENHGFYFGQKVQLLSTGGAPGGLATATDYYVTLPETIVCSGQVGKNFTTVAANHYLTSQMGPYKIRSDTTPSATQQVTAQQWIDDPTIAADQFDLVSEKGGTAPSVTTASSGYITIVPEEEAITDTFRLCTDPRDPRFSVVPLSTTGTGPHVFGTPVDEPVVIRTPWSLAEAWEVDFTQDESTLYFFHKNYRPWELRRFDTSAFRFIPMEITDGPYGDIAPAGTGAELEFTSTLANNDWMAVEDAECDTAYFRGTHVGTPLRKGYGPTIARVLNKSLIGHIERLTNAFAEAGELRTQYFDQPVANQLSITSHGFTANEPVCFVKGYGLYPAELSERTIYYVRVVNANVIELALTSGGAAMTLTDPGSGDDHKLITTWIDSTAHGFVGGEDWAGVVARGVLPEGIYQGTAYTIGYQSANIFYLTDRDGVRVPVRSAGEGRFFVSAGPPQKAVDVVMDIAPGSSGTTADDDATIEWYDSAWSGFLGWPSKAAFDKQRLLVANSDTEPETLWASVIAAPGDFNFDEFVSAGGADASSTSSEYDRTLTDSSGFNYRLLGGKTGEIQWLHGGITVLVGAESSVAALMASTNREALTPTNVNVEIRQRSGVSSRKPVDAYGDAVFETQNRQAVQATVFDGNSGAFNIDDITLTADHVCNSPVKQLAWQSEPYGVVWVLHEDGTLWGCTYSSRQGLAAWHRHTLGGTAVAIETIGVMSDTDDHGEQYDRLYLAVSRTVDGETVRFLEYLDSALRDAHAATSAYFVDAGQTATFSPATTAPTFDLAYLEGETVRVWADGAEQNDRVVTAGVITLDIASSVVSVGLPYLYRWESLPIEADLDQTVTIQGLRSRIVDAQIRLYRSLGGQIGHGVAAGQLYDIDYRSVSDILSGPIQLVTGLVKVHPGPGFGDEALLAIEGDTAAPFHLVALIARIDWSDRA